MVNIEISGVEGRGKDWKIGRGKDWKIGRRRKEMVNTEMIS